MIQRRTALLISTLGMALPAGCSGLVPHRNQPPGAMTGCPKGLYAMTAHVPGIGPFTGSTTALVAAEPTHDGFKANSRPGAVGELLGGFAGFLVDVLGDKRAPGGAFLHWSGPAPQREEPARGTVRSPRARLYADLYALDQPIELYAPGSDRLFGLLTLEPASADAFPTTDFATLVDRIDAVLAEHLFDPDLYAAPGTQALLRRLSKASTTARDDAEFVMGWLFASRQLEFSHLYLGRKLDPSFEDRFGPSSSISPAVSTKAARVTEADGIATLHIEHLAVDSSDDIDVAFSEIAELNPRGLVIDLRDCPGGTFAASRVGAHLIDAPLDAGVIFNRNARAKVLAKALDEFPVVSSVRSVEELLDLLEQHGAIRWRVEPASPRYAGPVVVLINGNVASAAEGLAAGLQESGRATLIGERTAGAMLSGRHFDVGQGWRLFVPTADYLTAAGVRLEGRGVPPDIQVSSEDAPQVAREFLATAQQQATAASRVSCTAMGASCG